jgi:hypothetical protein
MYTYQPHESKIVAAVKAAFSKGKVDIAMTQSQAIALRAQSYAMGKKLRKLAETDFTVKEVSDMVSAVTFSLIPEGLRIRRKDTGPAMEALEAALANLGVTVEDPNDVIIAESEKRMMERLKAEGLMGGEGEEAKPTRVTPYYTRK